MNKMLAKDKRGLGKAGITLMIIGIIIVLTVSGIFGWDVWTDRNKVVGEVYEFPPTSKGEACTSEGYVAEEWEFPKNMTIKNSTGVVALEKESRVRLEKAHFYGPELEKISDLDCLEYLDLEGMKISNVSKLSSMENLEELNLLQTNVSKSDCEKLDEQLTNTDVLCTFSEEDRKYRTEKYSGLFSGYYYYGKQGIVGY